VVENDSTLLGVMEQWFTAEGFQVHKAAGYSDAVALLSVQPVEVVVTDSLDFIPPNDEPGHLKTLKLAARDVPIVLFTGFAGVKSIDAVALGLAAVCAKPYFEELRAAIDRALQNQPTATA
jgi:DNA-binding NtrC family response regulator